MSNHLSRRDWFGNASLGIGGIAAGWLLHHDSARAAALPLTHHPAKAKRVIQIFCPGGVSHIDTFDHKPELKKFHGQPLGDRGRVDTFFGQPGYLMASPFSFARHGDCGQWVSELFPHLAGQVDRLTFLQALTAKSSNHTPAGFQMNTGYTLQGFPSIGSWVGYGLGSMSQELPTFVVLPDARGLPAGGAVNWSNGFLPATHQGVAFRGSGALIADLRTPAGTTPQAREAGLSLLKRMNEQYSDAFPQDSSLAARMRSYELAARMQLTVPEVAELKQESSRTLESYGVNRADAGWFGRNCLIARRLLERGVRFVQLWHGGAFGSPRINWDAHENVVENHRQQAAILDQPLAALIQDLDNCGMLEDTLVLWTTEFGRTPITQGIGAKGRDHHPLCFSIFMAGAGLKPGFSYGKSDDLGCLPAEGATSIYDFHATILHLLGIDHKRLTHYHNGIQRRLTDVHGEVIEPILA